jgi:hypothetical protein
MPVTPEIAITEVVRKQDDHVRATIPNPTDAPTCLRISHAAKQRTTQNNDRWDV